MVANLIKLGVDAKAKDGDGQTPAQKARAQGLMQHAEIIDKAARGQTAANAE